MKYTGCTVRQIRRKSGLVWQARLRYKDVTNGKWKEISKILPEAGGKKEAKKLADAWKNELNEAAELSQTFDKEKTVYEVVLDYLNYQYQSGEIEDSTLHIQLYKVDSLVKPYIGTISFITLDRTAIISWLQKLNAKGLSQGSIGGAYYTVRKVYNYYYELGELVKNPFTGVKPPKMDNPKITHLTNQQMQYFLQCLEKEPPKFRLACYLAFYGGLRRGEICGLRWRDVNLELGTISITSAIGVGMENYTKQPKNHSSIRTFPIVPQLLEELEKNVEEPNHFVIGKGTKFLAPNTLTFNFRKFVRKNNIVDAYGQQITLHSLRHNLGAVGIASGMDIASLSRMMGHSSRAMTLDTYGDASKDAMKVASKKLGKGFEKEKKNKKK